MPPILSELSGDVARQTMQCACASPKMGLKSNDEQFRTIGARVVGVALALGGFTACGRGPVCPDLLCLDWVTGFASRRRNFYLELGLVAGCGLYSAVGSFMVLCPLVLAVAEVR